jgi:thiol-disulfide isomerase/thioredoxin
MSADAFKSFGQILATSDNEKFARFGKIFEATARRCPGQKLELKGKTLDGKDLDWKAYRGKVVLVDFWASWCGPCIAEMPNVKEMYEKYHAKGFEVVGISLDRTRDALDKFMEKEKLPWQGLFDKDHELAKHFAVNSIPRPLLLDRQGRIVSTTARGAELGRLLEKYLATTETSSEGK